jgi:purine-binding chemotaxis protein CheW
MSNALATIKTDKESNELIQLVSFKLDNEEYGVEVLKVREIIRIVPITSMPNTPYFAEGIINLRGKVIPIISLRKKFGLMESENNNQTRIIVMDIANKLIGFIVDAVSEVIRISGNEIQPAPNIVSGGVDQECIVGVINQSERLLVMLDLENFFSQDETVLLNVDEM